MKIRYIYRVNLSQVSFYYENCYHLENNLPCKFASSLKENLITEPLPIPRLALNRLNSIRKNSEDYRKNRLENLLSF